MKIKIGTKQPVVMVCLIVALLVFSGCSSKFFGNSGAGENGFKTMLSQFWANVRPVKDLAVAHYKLGRFYQQKGQHQKAIIEFKKAILSYPEYITAYNALGMAYDAVSDYESAELAYSKAISLNPKLAYLYNNLGYSYLCRGDHDAAVIYFEKAVNLDGQKSKINNNLQLARTKSIENKLPQDQKSMIAVTNEPVDESLETQTAEVESIVNEQTNVKADNASDPSESKQAETETQKSYAIQLVANTYSSSSNIRNSVIDAAPIAYYGLKPRVNSEQSEKGTNEEQSQKEKGIRSVGIEVVNGNGVYGMARRTAGYLEKKGLKVYKISNAQHFGLDKTKILYKNGYLQEAYMVAKLIPGDQDFTKLNSLSSSNLHVQVLLGRDAISSQHILR